MFFYKKYTVFYIITILFIGINAVFSKELIPFSLPWNDNNTADPGILNLDGRDIPAGKDGFMHILDGHFFDGAGKRLRLLGVNTSFSGNYPTHKQAEYVAGRMAKYGINCVRFHHTDTSRAPRGIWKSGAPDKQTLDPDNLDRMDYFIYMLKKYGIYADINLKIGREVVEGDGFTDVDKLPTYDKGPDHYFPRMIELQKNYARDLLTHLNPYTGNKYVDEPAVAIVEINNESGLVRAWSNSDLDKMPGKYIEPLQNDWNDYLKTKYQDTESLRQAWAPDNPGGGQELLSRSLNGWTFQQIEQGKGTWKIVPEGPEGQDAIRVDVTAVGRESWHVQMYYQNLALQNGGFYKVSMRLRAEPARTVSVGIKMNHDPWENLDSTATVEITDQWKTYEFAFTPSQDDSNARLSISGLGNKLGTLWVSDLSMISSSPDGLPQGQDIQSKNIAWVSRKSFGENSIAKKRDWIDFLVQRESEYYRDMNQYLKNDLKLKSMIAGTQLNFGSVASQLENDFIDIHGYWQHPRFPNKSWDSIDWYVNNVSMVSAENNTLERLMMSRVAGQPYTCTEYNHPAPMTYSSEAIPLLAAYAAFQDWDGIFLYSYSHGNDYERKSINNFFDIYGHTPKMMAMPAAFNMFVRGDIAAGRETVTATISKSQYNDQLFNNNGNLGFRPMMDMGIDAAASYQHKTALRISDAPQETSNPDYQTTRRNMASDTGELLWNQDSESNSHVLYRAAKTKGITGFVKDSPFDLGHGMQLEVGETIQNWANVLLTYIEERDEGYVWLLAATGYHENQGMIWKDEEKTSVGNNWGEGPPLVEPIPLRLTIAASGNPFYTNTGARIFALNNVAEPEKELDNVVHTQNGDLVINLMNDPKVLWYKIVFLKDAEVGDCGEL